MGKADRELTAMVHGDLTPVDQLARVVEIVRGHRRPGAPRHPLNQLVPDRWLRAVLCRNPALVGLARCARPKSAPPANLTERDIAVAAGDGVVVACTVGISVDLVPAAADARAGSPRRPPDPGRPRPRRPPRHPPPGGPVARPAQVVAVPGDWRAPGEGRGARR